MTQKPGWQMHIARRPVFNYGRLLIAMNPYSYSVFNPAVARRLITINMDNAVVKDNSVMPAIYKNELAGIFNHILNIGVKHLIDNGGQIKITESMRKTTLDFHMRERDAVRWFNQYYFKLKPSANKSNKISLEQKIKSANPDAQIKFSSISEMYQQFRTWLEDVEGYNPNKLQLRKHFAQDLERFGVEES